MTRGSLRGLGLLIALGAVTACGAPAPKPGAEPQTVNVYGPASLLDPPPETRTAEPAPSTSSVAASAAAAPNAASTSSGATHAQPAPTVAPPKDLIEGPLPPVLNDAAGYLRVGAWQKAKAALTAALPTIEKGGAPDDVAIAHALLARAESALKDAPGARTDFSAATAAADAAEATIAADADEGRRALRLGRMALVRGEALFAAAEETRLQGTTKKAPVYAGSGAPADVTEFTSKKLGPWLVERRKGIDAAEAAYRKILDVRPFPPPVFVVRSAERVGGMYDALVAALANPPMPTAWKGDGAVNGVKKSEIRAVFADAIEQAVSPLRDRARGAFRICSEQGKRFGVATPDVATCDDWLAKHPSPNP